jgi:predicted AAA+ superfamily ATPase
MKKPRELLEGHNPWWSDGGWYEKDQLILEYQRGDSRVISRLYYHVKKNITISGKYGIVTMRGPRRCGKTTMIRLLIRELIESHGVNPANIFYIPLDYGGIKDVRLFEILKSIASAGSDEKYVFLDEASMYEDWALELKNAFDANIVYNGRLKIIATGSHSMDLAEAAEKLRGRQGELAREFNLGGNLLYTPLRFPEVVESISKEVGHLFDERMFRKVGKRFRMLKDLSRGIFSGELKELYGSYFATLSQLFDNYLIHGGYPKAVKEFYGLKSIDKGLYADLAELLINDSRKAGLDTDILKILLTDLVKPERLSGILNLSSIELKNVRKDELWKYLRYLTSTWAFFLSYSERKDGKGEPNYQDREHLKLYVLDPFIFHALHSYINNISNPFEEAKRLTGRPEFQGLLVESTIASHLLLAQQLFEHVPHVNYDRVLMYSARGGEASREIDFVLCVNKDNEMHRFLIESKYREQVRKTALPPGTIVLTKDLLEVDEGNKIVYIPVPIFLMLF